MSRKSAKHLVCPAAEHSPSDIPGWRNAKPRPLRSASRSGEARRGTLDTDRASVTLWLSGGMSFGNPESKDQGRSPEQCRSCARAAAHESDYACTRPRRRPAGKATRPGALHDASSLLVPSSTMSVEIRPPGASVAIRATAAFRSGKFRDQLAVGESAKAGNRISRMGTSQSVRCNVTNAAHLPQVIALPTPVVNETGISGLCAWGRRIVLRGTWPRCANVKV